MKKTFVILYYIVLLSFSSLSSESIEKVDQMIPLPNDKVMHSVMYSGFAIVIRASGFAANSAFIMGSVLAGLDEGSQTFSKGRDVSIFDWISDLIGLLIGIALYRFCQKNDI